jgi:hypothetical protein
MKILELFAGSRSFGRIAQTMNFEVFSTDINNFEKIDYVVDILNFDLKKIPFIPDIIWASPPCTCFSVASIGKHWQKNGQPKSDNAINAIEIVKKTIFIIDYFIKKNNQLIYFVENPRGKLRKLKYVNFFEKGYTITYCQYGDKRMKPTDIWTNSKTWKPKPICKNGDNCHISAPRGSKTGTQGLKNSFERSKIPEDLCKEILESIKK